MHYLTAAEHRAQAEELFAMAKRGLRDDTGTELDVTDVMAEAQLHATLAVAAALLEGEQP